MSIEQVVNAGYLMTEAMAAAPAGGQQGSGIGFMLTMVLMVVVFYFLLIRPQNKRAKEHKELISRIATGDEVVTSGGVVGNVTEVKEQYLKVQIADGVDIWVQRHHVGQVLPKDTIKSLK